MQITRGEYRRNRKWSCVWGCILSCLLILGICVQPPTVQAATPRVMVWGYSITEGEIYAGEDFELKLTLRNTASSVVKNVKLTVTTEGGEFLPTEGAGTAYADKIDGQKEAEFTFLMAAGSGLEEKAYKLKLKTEYEDKSGMGYTVEEEIFLPVSLKQRLSVTDIFIPEHNIQLGDTIEVGASVNNLGDGTLYRVTVRLQGDNVDEMTSYIGNIEAGKQGNVDILSKASGISQIGDKNEITIIYEDKKGNSYEETFPLSISVAQPVYENLEVVKKAPNYGKLALRIGLITVGVLAVLGIAGYIVWKRKKKQKLLEEF